MNKELFGVFGDADDFEQFASTTEFARVVEGDRLTLGVRDVGMGLPNRTSIAADDDGVCVVWGEAYPPASTANAAAWFRERYAEDEAAALDDLNGSYLVALDTDEGTFVATDPARTWECYYTDDPGCRLFGTNPTRVARAVESPTVQQAQLLEFVHLGLVLGRDTTLAEVQRVPFDGRLFGDRTERLDRFVYDPRDPSNVDYAGELADRLQRAIRRRATNPGRKGLLLSGGYDSRTVLACLPDVDDCFTVGLVDSPETNVAKSVANQYGANHETLVVDSRYLNTTPDVVRYGHGIKESLHIHHAGYTAQMNVDTMYHGLLFDTFLRGHFLPSDGVDLFGHTFPRARLDPDPDPVGTLIHDSFGYIPASQRVFPDCQRIPEGSEEFVRERLQRQFDALEERYDSVYNGIELVGIQNQPTTTFRTHLADHYIESFVAADAELLEWHLTTPPEYRSNDTFLEAIRRIDPEILRHRPPDRPHDSYRLNEVERFVRSNVPFLTPFTKSWPNRDQQYEQRGLDQELFPGYPELHDLPVRLKLRINDIRCWLNDVADADEVTPLDVLCPRAPGPVGIESPTD